MKNKETKKNSNGWILVGQSVQYYKRECKLTINEMSVMISILDSSFAFKKRWCYMRYSDFDITNSKTLKSVLDSLVSKKILSYKNTFSDKGHKALNEYKILEPKSYIDNFVFVNEKDDSNNIVNTRLTANKPKPFA